MQGNYTTPTQPAVGLSFLCILLDITKTLWNESNKNGESMFVETTNFYDGTLMYSNIDRLGGILSHLKKVNRSEMINLLGENHIALSSQATVDLQNLGDICEFALLSIIKKIILFFSSNRFSNVFNIW